MRRNALVVVYVVSSLAVLSAADGPYSVVKEITIGGPGGWDYITVDPAAHRIYVSHATKIVVADTNSGAIVGEIADTPGVHGIAVAPDLGLGYTSNGRDNTSTIVDLKTLKPVMKVMTGGNPDAIFYERGRHEVYTFNGQGQSATVFDAKSGNVIATIPLMGKPEAPAFDADTAGHLAAHWLRGTDRPGLRRQATSTVQRLLEQRDDCRGQPIGKGRHDRTDRRAIGWSRLRSADWLHLQLERRR
jgi:hypothetical protein